MKDNTDNSQENNKKTEALIGCNDDVGHAITSYTDTVTASIKIYTINEVNLAFWLVLAYDLFEDRHTIDVINTKFFLLHFKMAESFEK